MQDRPADILPSSPSMADKPANPRRRIFIRLGVLVAILATLWIVGQQTGILSNLDAQAIRTMVQDAGPWGWLAYLALFAIATVVQAPGMLFVAAAGLAFGKVAGFFLAHLGAIIAVSINFALARSVGGDALTKLDNKLMRRILKHIERRPIGAQVVLRLVFWIAPPMNYLLALSGIRYRDFLIAAVIGLIPPILAATCFFDWLFT